MSLLTSDEFTLRFPELKSVHYNALLEDKVVIKLGENFYLFDIGQEPPIPPLEENWGIWRKCDLLVVSRYTEWESQQKRWEQGLAREKEWAKKFHRSPMRNIFSV